MNSGEFYPSKNRSQVYHRMQVGSPRNYLYSLFRMNHTEILAYHYMGSDRQFFWVITLRRLLVYHLTKVQLEVIHTVQQKFRYQCRCRHHCRRHEAL